MARKKTPRRKSETGSSGPNGSDTSDSSSGNSVDRSASVDRNSTTTTIDSPSGDNEEFVSDKTEDYDDENCHQVPHKHSSPLKDNVAKLPVLDNDYCQDNDDCDCEDLDQEDDDGDQRYEHLFHVTDNLRDANNVMERARHAGNDDEYIQLCRQALALSNDCVEAHMGLYSYEALSPEDKIARIRQAISAAERVITERGFRELKDNLWETRTSRGYLIALEDLADTLIEQGERNEAIELYQQILDLNPDDNQNICLWLPPLLLDAERYLDLARFFKKENTKYCIWLLFTKALFLFKTSGRSLRSSEAMEEALQYNPHVIEFLAGLRELPEEQPLTYAIGDEDEAAAYVLAYGEQWLDTDGALEWMADVTAKTIQSVMNNPFLKQQIVRELIDGLTEEFELQDTLPSDLGFLTQSKKPAEGSKRSQSKKSRKRKNPSEEKPDNV